MHPIHHPHRHGGRRAPMLRLLPRIALAAALLATPLVGVHQVRADSGRMVEAVEAQGGGVGLFLLILLQRA